MTRTVGIYQTGHPGVIRWCCLVCSDGNVSDHVKLVDTIFGSRQLEPQPGLRS